MGAFGTGMEIYYGIETGSFDLFPEGPHAADSHFPGYNNDFMNAGEQRGYFPELLFGNIINFASREVLFVYLDGGDGENDVTEEP